MLHSTWRRVFTSALCILSLQFWSCGADDGADESADVRAMTVKYGEVARWSDLFPDSGCPLSVELQTVLDAEPDTPYLFFVQLDDVIKEDSAFIVLFSDMWYTPFDHVFQLELHCSDRQRAYILSQPRAYFGGDYAVIARVVDFSRPRYGVSVWQDEDDPTWSEIDIYPSELYVLRGVLLDALYLGDNTEASAEAE